MFAYHTESEGLVNKNKNSVGGMAGRAASGQFVTTREGWSGRLQLKYISYILEMKATTKSIGSGGFPNVPLIRRIRKKGYYINQKLY